MQTPVYFLLYPISDFFLIIPVFIILPVSLFIYALISAFSIPSMQF